MKPKEAVIALFKKAEQTGLVAKYNKFGKVTVRKAKPGEVIDTIIGGKKETTNTAKTGDVVVQNPTGELYVMTESKFLGRYTVSGTIGAKPIAAKATGSCWAFQYKGQAFSFQAPWGEEMIVEPGDFIAQSAQGNYDDIYRIEKNAFKRTYRPNRS